MPVGLTYKKLDLHIHTPASSDFRDKSVAPEDIVNRSLEMGLDAIAITDHNTGAWIDLVKESALGTDLTVFPGVEIHCADGKRGIHMIAIFDTDKDSEHVKGLLSRLGITPEQQGNINALTDDLGLTSIIDIIQDRKWQGIAIPAHVSSKKGIINDMSGQKRIQIIQHRNLIALEDRWDLDSVDGSAKKNAIDFLDGGDPDYQRKLAVYQASDNPSDSPEGGHGLKGIGSRFTYFKMEYIDLESLRQCLLDPDVRVLQANEPETFEYPRIARISIENGFLGGETVAFNEGLNSILGGKGTGKSLLIELMRFALKQSPEREEIKRDHESKLANRLGKLGVVEVEFVDESEKTFILRRTNDPVSIGYSEIKYDPSQVFPVLFLSQNEIIRIAEDESLQLDFIDRFFPYKVYEERIRSIEFELTQLDSRLAEGLQALEAVTELTQSVTTVDMKLKQVDDSLDAPIFRKYAAAVEKQEAIQNQVDCAHNIQLLASEFHESLSSIQIPELATAHVDDHVLKANSNRLAGVQHRIKLLADEMIRELEDVRADMVVDQTDWDSTFKKIRQDHVDHVRNEGGDHTALASEREQLQQRLTRLKTELRTAQKKVDRMTEIANERTARLNEIDDVYREWRSARLERCDYFQSNSDGKLLLNIIASSDSDEFQRRLLQLKRGSNVRDTDIEKVTSTNRPRSFVQSLLEYKTRSSVPLMEETSPLQSAAEKAGLPLERVAKLADFLLARENLEEVLEVQYKAHRKDRPDIKFRIGHDRFEALNSISVGQKCTALLIMTLTDGKMPVVIDQPEDSLDIRSIWEDICAKVRVKKNRRQFIFTTHNSSVAVASDTDSFVILEADADRGRVVFSGSMDSNDIGDEVLKYLEGGTDPYMKKYIKYRADKRIASLRH